MYIYEFITMVIPKAGFLYNDIPINLSTFLLPIILLINVNKFTKFMRLWDFSVLYFALFFLSCFLIVINWGKNMFLVTANLVIIVSPAIIALGYYANKEKFMKILIAALIITGTYSLIQYFWGIDKTAIYGLTIAYGDSYSNKPMGYLSTLDTAVKMPSTYQNGNGIGCFCIIGLPIVMSYDHIKLNKKWTKLRKLAIITGFIGLLLSGSRACFYSFLVVLVWNFRYLFKSFFRLMKKNYILSLLLFVMAPIIIFIIFSYKIDSEFISRMYERYIQLIKTDTTGAGRTIIFKNYVHYIFNANILKFIYYILFGVEWNSGVAGDLLGFFENNGLLYSFVFISCLAYPLYKMRKQYSFYMVGLYCTILDFIVDSSYNYPPILFNYFWIAGFILQDYYSGRYLKKSYKNNTMKERSIV